MVLKERDTPPTANEIAFASGHKEFTGEVQAEYIKVLEARASTIVSVFMRQEQASMVCYILLILVTMEPLKSPFRDLSMLQSSGIFSQSGLLPVTSPLMRWRSQNLSAWCSMHTIQKRSSISLIDKGYDGA